MRVRVELSSALRRYVQGYDPERGVSLDLPEDSEAAGLISALSIPAKEITVIMVNRQAVRPEHPLADGDLVGLFPALGGG
jgi:molybdopterin synthase sulfur carrier subunit